MDSFNWYYKSVVVVEIRFNDKIWIIGFLG